MTRTACGLPTSRSSRIARWAAIAGTRRVGCARSCMRCRVRPARGSTIRGFADTEPRRGRRRARTPGLLARHPETSRHRASASAPDVLVCGDRTQASAPTHSILAPRQARFSTNRGGRVGSARRESGECLPAGEPLTPRCRDRRESSTCRGCAARAPSRSHLNPSSTKGQRGRSPGREVVARTRPADRLAAARRSAAGTRTTGTTARPCNFGDAAVPSPAGLAKQSKAKPNPTSAAGNAPTKRQSRPKAA